jgi:hypothetical protein
VFGDFDNLTFEHEFSKDKMIFFSKSRFWGELERQDRSSHAVMAPQIQEVFGVVSKFDGYLASQVSLPVRPEMDGDALRYIPG